MSEDFTATIAGDSERAQNWRKILGGSTAYLKSFVPSFADLPGKPDAKFYELDIPLLESDQRKRLVSYISEKFNFSEVEIENQLDEIGCPILAEDISVGVAHPWKWA